MFISLSAVNQDSVKAFLRLLAMAYKSYDLEYDAEERRYMTYLRQHADEFIKKFKLTKQVDAALKGLVRGDNPNEEDELDEDLSILMDAVGALKISFNKEHDIERTQLSLFNDLRLAHKGSESAAKRLMRSVSTLGDPKVTQFFTHEEDAEAVSDVYDDLKALVKKHGKTSGLVMPANVLAAWQEENKAKGKRNPAHDSYLKLRRAASELYKKALANMVRGSNKPYLPVHDVAKALNARGIAHPLPTGFVGNIDDIGNYYTTAGRKLIQTPSGQVRMNPNYDAEKDNAYVCVFTPPFAQNETRAYTVDYRSGAKAEKFNVVAEVMPKLSSLTKKWLPDMRKLGKSREGVLAVLCEFIFETSARVGNKNAATAGNKTYGATQLLVKHFNLTANGATVTYIGKSGGKQIHKLKFNSVRGKQLGDALHKLVEGKTANDLVFTFREMPVSSAQINRYMQSIGFPKGFTVHKLRTARGTEMAISILKSCPYKKGDGTKDTVIHKWLENELLKIGEELGHMSGDKITSSTAIQNYISPEILADFYNKLGVRPSAKVQKAIDSIKKDAV